MSKPAKRINRALTPVKRIREDFPIDKEKATRVSKKSKPRAHVDRPKIKWTGSVSRPKSE